MSACKFLTTKWKIKNNNENRRTRPMFFFFINDDLEWLDIASALVTRRSRKGDLENECCKWVLGEMKKG